MALIVGLGLDVAGLLGAPTPLWAWAWQAGLVLGGVFVLLMFWRDEIVDFISK